MVVPFFVFLSIALAVDKAFSDYGQKFFCYGQLWRLINKD